MARHYFSQTDLGRLAHCVSETAPIERPPAVTVRRLWRAYNAAGGDFRAEFPELANDVVAATGGEPASSLNDLEDQR